MLNETKLLFTGYRWIFARRRGQAAGRGARAGRGAVRGSRADGVDGCSPHRMLKFYKPDVARLAATDVRPIGCLSETDVTRLDARPIACF